MNFIASPRRPGAAACAAAPRGGCVLLPAVPAPPTEGDADGGDPGLARRRAA